MAKEGKAGGGGWDSSVEFFQAYFEADHPSFGPRHLLPAHQPTLVVHL